MKLNYNGLYTFRYKPVTLGQIPVYDKTPLIFILDIRETNILGINIHWIPKQHRLEFFEAVREIMNKTHIVHKKKERMRLTYELVKKPEFRVGLQAIRMYYFDGMSMFKEIPEKQWDVVVGIRQYRARFLYKNKKYKE